MVSSANAHEAQKPIKTIRSGKVLDGKGKVWMDAVSRAGMDPERLARIPARMKEFVAQGTIPGAVTLVARHGVVAHLEAVGYQDLEGKKPMRTDTIFQIRSMTKSVTAVGIMILLEEGRLTLSDPVEKHLPEFRGQLLVDSRDGEKVLTTKKPSRPITIRDLLTHTSGMPDDRVLPSEINEHVYPKRDKTLAEIVPLLAQQLLQFEPGTKFQYSDPGFTVLGRIIEVASGQAYQDFVAQRIFRPLGMKDSFYFVPPEKRDRVAPIYKLENGKLQKEDMEPYLKPAKFASPDGGIGVFSTALDMAAFYQMMLNGGTYNGARILSRASVELMTTVHTGDLQTTSPGMGYGLGWFVVRDPLGASQQLGSIGSYGHSGARGTYGWSDPKRDLIGVFMIQLRPRSPGEWSMLRSLRNTFIAMANAAIVD